MTPDDFRQLALSLPEARHAAPLGNVTFSVRGKTFATVGVPDPGVATLRLSPADQVRALGAGSAFHPQPGGAGARGWTCVRLSLVDRDACAAFLKAAHRLACNSKSTRTVLPSA